MNAPQRWKSLPRAACCAGGLLLGLTGCTSTRVSSTETVTTPGRDFGSPQELVAVLNFAVGATPETPQGAKLAAALGQRLNGHLAAQGMTIKPAAPDVTVTLSADETVFDQSGEYFLLEGRATGSILSAADRKLIASESFTIRGKRALGIDAARLALVDALSPKIQAWVSGATVPGIIPIAACELRIGRPFFSLRRGDPNYIDNFVRKVGAMKGIHRCELVTDDKDNRVYVFRIVYLKETYPQGVLNAIILANPELKLKK